MSPVGDTHSHCSAVTSGFSGHISMLAPGGHVPTLPHVPRSWSPIPFHVPRVTFLFPQPVHPLGSRSQCSDGGSAAHGSLHGARLEDRSWSGVACRHAAALYSKRCAGLDLSSRLYRRLELRRGIKLFFPAARLSTLWARMRCRTQAAERSA
jgi:hypothetical protein